LKRLLALVRRLATLPGLRRLTRFELVLRVSFALRAVLVTERLRFAFNELRPGKQVSTYSLRRTGVRVSIRHHTPDVLILDEVFSQDPYEPPEAAAAALARLERPLRVLDLGANIGLFGAWVLGRFPVESIHAIEPDAENAAIHELTVEANGSGAKWQLTRAFAAERAGTVRFHAGEFTTSRLAAPGEEAVSVPAIDVLPLLAEVDLAKLDVEGAEWPIILDDRFRSSATSAVVLEYHESTSPEQDARALAERVLGEAGYSVALTGADPNLGTGLIWAWRG
jgi:FkbM family methyltransferase